MCSSFQASSDDSSIIKKGFERTLSQKLRPVLSREIAQRLRSNFLRRLVAARSVAARSTVRFRVSELGDTTGLHGMKINLMTTQVYLSISKYICIHVYIYPASPPHGKERGLGIDLC